MRLDRKKVHYLVKLIVFGLILGPVIGCGLGLAGYLILTLAGIKHVNAKLGILGMTSLGLFLAIVHLGKEVSLTLEAFSRSEKQNEPQDRV